MKIIIQNATITVYMTPETSEEEQEEEKEEDAKPAPDEPPKEEVKATPKKKFPVPVNSPESFAICRRIAEEERKRKKMTANPINGKIEKRPRKPRTKITPSIEERIREMTKEGLSIKTQATALGVSPTSVQRIRKRQEEENRNESK